MVISSLALSFPLVFRASSPAVEARRGKRERKQSPSARPSECGRTSDSSETDGAKSAEGRIRDFAETTASKAKEVRRCRISLEI